MPLLLLAALAFAVLVVDAICSARVFRVSPLLLLLLPLAVAVAVVAVDVEWLTMLPPLRFLLMRVIIMHYLQHEETCMLNCVTSADCMACCCRDKQISCSVL